MTCTKSLFLVGIGGLALAIPGQMAAQGPFDGVVAFRMTNAEGEKPDTFIQTTKGNSIKLEGMTKRRDAFIFDGDKHRMLVVQPAEKKYLVMTEQDMQQMRAMTEAMRQQLGKKAPGGIPDEDDTKVKFAKTGRIETVAGTRCEVWHATTVREGKQEEGEACIADGVGFMAFNVMLSNPMFAQAKQPKLLEEYRKVVGPNKGVLKVVEIENGKPRTAIEAIRIQRVPVGADAFEPPAGYAAVNMHDQLMQMQQGMQKMQARPKEQAGDSR